MVKSFRDLHVWQKAMDLADAVYTATGYFPRTETFGLTAQVRRAAISIPSNIAEGHAIGGGRYLFHLRVAIGSEAELQTQFDLAVRRGYMSRESASALINDAAEIGRMLQGLFKSIERQRARARMTAVTTLLIVAYAASLIA